MLKQVEKTGILLTNSLEFKNLLNNLSMVQCCKQEKKLESKFHLFQDVFIGGEVGRRGRVRSVNIWLNSY